jgi:ABC-type sugar transport system substrate-binding protein
LSILEQFPTIEVILGPYAEFDRVKGYEAAQNLIAAHPDLDLIIGLSTTMARRAGAEDALGAGVLLPEDQQRQGVGVARGERDRVASDQGSALTAARGRLNWAASGRKAACGAAARCWPPF